MVERDVPPIVDGGEAFRRPAVAVADHPGDAFGMAAPHLHHMRDGMLRPAVPRLEIDGAAAVLLGFGIFAVFLEAEGLHAEHRMIARRRRRPSRACPRD